VNTELKLQKLNGQRPIARPRSGWEDNINMHLKEWVCAD